MRYAVTKRVEWDAAHRVPLHESKCRALHGHRYAAEITVSSNVLDDAGRVVDFGWVGTHMRTFVDAFFDHTVILFQEDPLAADILRLQDSTDSDRKVYLMERPPTAENIAAELYRIADRRLSHLGRVDRVRVYETPTCWADYPAGVV
jgi:6-pyruvoyltetrahydropterin/6-carboxytetrahydropterin synthase